MNLNINDSLLGYAMRGCMESVSKYRKNVTKFAQLSNKDLFALYGDKSFCNMKEGDLAELFAETHNRIADIMGIPACQVVYGNLTSHTDSIAVYNRGKANITVNKEVLEENLRGEGKIDLQGIGYYYLSVIMHETRHSYQTCMVNKMRLMLPMSNRDKHVALYDLLVDTNRKVLELDGVNTAERERNSLGDYKLLPGEFDCRNYTVELFEELMEKGEIKSSKNAQSVLQKLRVGQINDFDCLKDRGVKTDFDQLESLSYYAKTANLNRFLLIQYQGRNSEFLTTVAEQVDNDKYMEGLVKFYNYQLEKAVEFDKSVELGETKQGIQKE